jgi:hypothetical protein
VHFSRSVSNLNLNFSKLFAEDLNGISRRPKPRKQDNNKRDLTEIKHDDVKLCRYLRIGSVPRPLE